MVSILLLCCFLAREIKIHILEQKIKRNGKIFVSDDKMITRLQGKGYDIGFSEVMPYMYEVRL
jgi:hypothetical protein